MAVFPDIRWPIYPIQETTPDISYKGQVENMTLITRKKTTRTLRAYSVGYKLPTTDYYKLRAFYDVVNCSGVFDWVHPETRETLTVRFADQLDFAANDYGVWMGTVKLQEV